MNHGIIFGTRTLTLDDYFAAEEVINRIDDNPIMRGEYTQIPANLPSRTYGAYKIATHIRELGWDVEVIDMFHSFTMEEIKQLLRDRVTHETKFIGFSVFNDRVLHLPNTPNYHIKGFPKRRAINDTIDFIRSEFPWVQTVTGSQKLEPISLLHSDWTVTGFGEFGMEALCKYFTGGPEPKHTKLFNMWGIENDPDVLFTLNVINATHSYPAFPKKYARMIYEDRDYIQENEALNIEFSRGCMFKCSFCTYAPLGVKGDMTRDVDDFYDEMMENYERFGTTTYLVSDETFNDDSAKIAKFAEACRKLPFQPIFHGYVRGDLMVSRGEEDWDNMLDMGFVGHHYGLETLNWDSGKAIKKGMNPEKLKEGMIDVANYFDKNSPTGYYCGEVTMIAGLPHDTLDSLTEEAKFWNNGLFTAYYNPLEIGQPEKIAKNPIDPRSVFDTTYAQHGYTWETVDDFDIRNYLMTEITTPNGKVSLKHNPEELIYTQNRFIDTYNSWTEEEKIKRHYVKWRHREGYSHLDAYQWVQDYFMTSQNANLFRRPSPWMVSSYLAAGIPLEEVYSQKGNFRRLNWDETKKLFENVKLYKDMKLASIGKY